MLTLSENCVVPLVSTVCLPDQPTPRARVATLTRVGSRRPRAGHGRRPLGRQMQRVRVPRAGGPASIILQTDDRHGTWIAEFVDGCSPGLLRSMSYEDGRGVVMYTRTRRCSATAPASCKIDGRCKRSRAAGLQSRHCRCTFSTLCHRCRADGFIPYAHLTSSALRSGGPDCSSTTSLRRDACCAR